MAVLCGLMLGSLRKIWPFQNDTTPDLPLKEKIFASYWPQWDGSVALSLVLVMVSLAAVLVVERLVAGTDENPPRMTEQDHG
jgi:putative membrane protein